VLAAAFSWWALMGRAPQTSAGPITAGISYDDAADGRRFVALQVTVFGVRVAPGRFTR
jgi:hypothetical protein